MFRDYFKTAWRNLVKNKVFSMINVLGLSIGIACCLIIGIYILHEFSYDRFFPDARHIYRVVQEQEQAGDLYQVASTPAPLPEALKNGYPEVLESTAFTRVFGKRLFQYQDKSFEEENGFHVNASFFRIFPFPTKEGSLQPFFDSTHAILLTESMARKYFNNDDPVGKVISIDHKADFVVAAVLKDPPANSHLKFDFLLPMKSAGSTPDLSSWGNNWVYTYILLKRSVDTHAFETKIRNFLSDQIKEPDWQPRLYLQSLVDIHLHSDFDFSTDFADIGNLQQIYLFGAIGLIILLISGINFVNLTTSRSFRRNKETGIRRVAGASRKQLIFRFMSESLLYVSVSAVVALVLAGLLLPYLGDLSGLPLAFSLTGIRSLSVLMLVITLVAGLLTGVYPALVLSGTNAIRLFEEKSFFQRGTQQISSGKILVVIQFSLSMILIVCAIMIRQQMHYVLNRDLGFDKEHILYTRVKGELEHDARYRSFKNALLQQSSIIQVTRSSGLPINHEGSFEGVEWEGMADNHRDFLMSYFQTDETFVGAYGLQILEGGDFLPQSPDDTTSYYLVNQTALRAMQMDDPVGKRLEKGIIVGVVKDFNFQPAFKRIGPMILCSDPGAVKRFISIRTTAGNTIAAVNMIEKLTRQFNPGYPVEYHFLDAGIEASYDRQSRLGRFINLFAALAVFISCLGLFGLAAFTAERRIKEIGIRKVNGARVSEILSMLNKDFVKWVAIAFVIATPIAYYAMTKWLENFAYKTELSWWIFALAGILALGIALLTVSWQSWKAATRNPVEALRYE